jgi:hypothetical protein
MKTSSKRRAYGKLREIIERHGGSMAYRRQGYRYGAWEISLGGKKAIIEAMGCRSFPRLDRLFVPAVLNPRTWDDYRNELVANAEEKLLALAV